ncbi:MAG: T9SS type A sorting domain-containing protein [Chitinophagales bacterium]
MKYALLIYVTCFTINLYAQKETNNWVFGDSLLMTFTDTGINCVQIPTKVLYESSASISDSLGNLLFHTDGRYVWNKLNEVMPNGCCLNIEQYGVYGSSVTQGALIIPKPGNLNLYYIFTKANDTISYSIMDINGDGGLGDIVEKNLPILIDTTMEKMHAIKHANGRDWWLLVHESIPSFNPGLTNKFYKFLITPDGISGPFIQNVGNLIDFYTSIGEMIFSPDGSKIALSGYNFVELFDFDRCTGDLTEFAYIDNFDMPSFATYGCSFSPDGNKIYLSSKSVLYQYCLNCNDSIEETKVLLFENPYGGYFIGQHELGPDGRIYFIIGYNLIPNNIYTYKNMNLCVINEPNLLGDACNIDTSTIWLGGRRAITGLPNMVNYSLGAIPGSECDTLGVNVNTLEHKEIFSVFPNPTTDILHINYSGSENMFYTLTITNATGTEVFKLLNFNSNKEINVKSFPAGVYFYTIYADDKSIQSGTIVKN